ncbi:hypothetical protein B566_EDAN001454, partial [Ephemera danica]
AAGQQPRKRGRSRHKGRSIDPARPTSSQSSSDLSSPNETCYSFVRRALQKLAGGRRGGRRHRAWFLDSWNACTKEPSCAAATDVTPDALLAEVGRRAAGRDDSQDDVADALDLPIELRRLEDVEPSPSSKNVQASPPRRRRTLACSVPTPPRLDPTPLKSQSLGDILDTARPAESLVRSRSSVARLPVLPPVEVSQSPTPPAVPTITTSSHPQLVRQKRSLCEDDEEGEEAAREAEDRPGPAPTRRADLRDLVRALPEVGAPRRGVPKQRSLNDELMATQRQREKARVRQNITKQASLNEQLLSRGPLGSLKDSLLASPRFQQLRSGLTKLTSISASPADATKVAGQSFKNGFVRMLQNWKGSEPPPDVPHLIPPTSPLLPPQSTSTPPVSPLRRCAEDEAVLGLAAPAPSRCERRLSREEGSDSSKDSSLQSDTSVDSEDSFASVIFVPKPESKSSPPEKSPPPAPPNPPVEPVETVVEPVAPEVAPPPQAKQGTIRAETLKRIQLLLQERAPRAPVFPLVRRSSAHPVGRTDQSLARPIPRLLSLELFNPETDDLDSDSSGVSSPDSVISVMEPAGRILSEKTVVCTAPAELLINDEVPETQRPASSLLEAAANVASSLEGAVDAVIQSSPRARRKLAAMGLRGSPSPPPVPPRPSVWDEECRQHLTEFADRLSEKLLQEIDRYSETLQSSSSRNSHFRAMARFPREHSPEASKLAGEEEIVRLDPERYLQDLQEINSDIGSQLAKLNEELESLPLHINVNNNNNSPRLQSPNNNTNHAKKNKTVANLISPAKELPDCNENRKTELKCSTESLTSCSQSTSQNPPSEAECNPRSGSEAECNPRSGSERERSQSIMSGHDSEHSQNSLSRSRPDLERSLSTSGRSPSSLSGPESERSHGRSPSGSEQERSHSAASRSRPDLERSLSTSGRSPSSLSGPESERSHGRSPSGSEQEHSQNSLSRSRPDLERSLSTSGRSPSSLSGPESERSHGRSPSGSEQERSHSGRSPSSLSGPEVSQSVSGRSVSSLSGPEPPTRQVSWEESSPELRRDTSRDSGEDAMCRNKRKSLTRQLASVTGWPELETVPPKVTKTESYETSLSGSTSQDSLQSSSAGSGGPIGAGGSLTFHRYYHVFREGELDTLIERYVENLHIISSYYDHANWCVIAEKVQVWTI